MKLIKNEVTSSPGSITYMARNSFTSGQQTHYDMTPAIRIRPNTFVNSCNKLGVWATRVVCSRHQRTNHHVLRPQPAEQ